MSDSPYRRLSPYVRASIRLGSEGQLGGLRASQTCLQIQLGWDAQMDVLMDGRNDKRNFSQLCRISSPIRAAAQKCEERSVLHLMGFPEVMDVVLVQQKN